MLYHLHEGTWVRRCVPCDAAFPHHSERCPTCDQPRRKRRADINLLGKWRREDELLALDTLDASFHSGNWKGMLFGSAGWLGPGRITLSQIVHDGGPEGLTRVQATDRVSDLLEAAGFLIEGGI